MMNRSLLELVRTVPSDCCMHDWWIALAASCFGVIEWIDEPLYSYRQHEDNVMGAKETGILKDAVERLGRSGEVARNYRRMF